MNARALKDKAQDLFVRGKFQKSMEAYWLLIEADGSDPHLRLRHAEACRRAGQLGQAVESYRVAAHLLSRLGHLGRAQASVKMALELSPRDPSLHAALREVGGQQSVAASPAPAEPLRPELHPPQRVRPRAITLDSMEAVSIEAVKAAPKDVATQMASLPPTPVVPVKVSRPVAVAAPEPEEMSAAVESLDESIDEGRAAKIFVPLIRRIDACTIAIKPTADARWVRLHSREPINVRFVNEVDPSAQPVDELNSAFAEGLQGEIEFRKLYVDRNSTH